jgi:outer membrane immunogenic protein
MKKVLLGALGLLVSAAAPAVAADLSARVYTKAPAVVAPIYNWAGFYVGINGGGGWARKCWDFTNDVGGVPVAPVIAEGCHTASGGLIGGQVGYRWQSANWVFGLEAQGDWANLKGSNVSLLTAPFRIFNNNSKVDAIGLFTGQVGYAWNNVLWYAKGGAAVAHDKYYGQVIGLTFDTSSETRWGGTVGTGIEFGFAPNWSVAVEYDHLFMGRHSNTFNFATAAAPFVGASRIDSIRQDVDMVTARVNYHFGGPIVAKY